VTRRRVLFLYNETGWAIHNVGLDWAALLAGTHEFTLRRFATHESLDPEGFDHVVWGYSTLRYSGRLLLASLLQRPLGWLRWRRPPRELMRTVVQERGVPRAARLARGAGAARPARALRRDRGDVARDA
jgi:hypothetical protein